MNKSKGITTAKSYLKHWINPLLGLGNVPIWTHLWITRKCNLRCKYCYVHSNNYPELDTLEMKRAITHIHEVLGSNFLAFMGGEPLIRKDLPQLIQHASDLYMNTFVTTNATLLNDKNIISICDAGLDGLEISLDGMNSNNSISQKTGDRILKNVDNFLSYQDAYDTELTINMVITKQNYRELFEILRYIGNKRISLTTGLYIPDPTSSQSIFEDELAFTSEKDLQILKDLVMRIKRLKKIGCFIAHPKSYYERWVPFMNQLIAQHSKLENKDKNGKNQKKNQNKKFWTCYAGNGFLEIDCDGTVRYCSYLNDIIKKGYSIFDLTPQYYKDLEYYFKTMINHCNHKCLANCFYQSSYIRRHGLQFYRKTLLPHLLHQWNRPESEILLRKNKQLEMKKIIQ